MVCFTDGSSPPRGQYNIVPTICSVLDHWSLFFALPGSLNRAERCGQDAQSQESVSGLALSRTPRLKVTIYCAPLRKSHG